jgi:hypothetical protein
VQRVIDLERKRLDKRLTPTATMIQGIGEYGCPSYVKEGEMGMVGGESWPLTEGQVYNPNKSPYLLEER